jgi:hypothetical protein
MGVIVGGLVVVVAIIGVMMFSGGHFFGGTKNVDVNIHGPSLPAAAPK